MYRASIRKVLKKLETGQFSIDEAFSALKDLPYDDLGFAKLDNHRTIRRGFPEVIYCGGKSFDQIENIVRHLMRKKTPILMTRVSPECFRVLKNRHPALRYNELGQVVFLKRAIKPNRKGYVIVVTAGTSDIPVAEEARTTLDVMGNTVKVLYDVGVAGIHRLLDKKHLLNGAKAIIVVAGMEGALASVISGLVSKPVIAVPTSVGYGASFKGLAALLAMLNCCSPGVTVVNIDNGFGAGYFASLINK
jgi:pyridinium-3,5-biscarboxylic acid mononucleotide synthase